MDGFFVLMTIKIIFVLLPTFVVASKSVTQFYVEYCKIDDKLGNSSLLGIFSGNSRLTCASGCNEQCTCIGYNSRLKKCRIHERCPFNTMRRPEGGWQYLVKKVFDCKELFDNGVTMSGVYTIQPVTNQLTDVYCDMETNGGGWTVLLKRIDGSVNFTRSWNDYKTGFGDVFSEYWIGNDFIHHLTRYDTSKLYVSITHVDGRRFFERYNRFSISDEANGYLLHFGGAFGTLGDAMTANGFPWSNLNGMKFSTIDKDQDKSPANCALSKGGGGWWYKRCRKALLTGPYGSTDWGKVWSPTFNSGVDVRRVEMMVKRKATK